MARIKYVRVSTADQNTARQEQDLKSFDKVYIEKLSGKNMQRPQLQAMLEYVREGDTVVVESYSRLARSTKDLLEIVEVFRRKGVGLISQKEQIDTSTPAGKLMLTMFAALAQFERECTLERQREGIDLAKAEGRMGRPKAQPCADFDALVQRWRNGEISAKEAIKHSGVSKASFYRMVEKRGL